MLALAGMWRLSQLSRVVCWCMTGCLSLRDSWEELLKSPLPGCVLHLSCCGPGSLSAFSMQIDRDRQGKRERELESGRKEREAEGTRGAVTKHEHPSVPSKRMGNGFASLLRNHSPHHLSTNSGAPGVMPRPYWEQIGED